MTEETKVLLIRSLPLHAWFSRMLTVSSCMTTGLEAPTSDLPTEAEGYKLILSAKSLSGYKGVAPTVVQGGTRFQANYAGKKLGTFDTPVEAAVAYAKEYALDIDRKSAEETEENLSGLELAFRQMEERKASLRALRTSASNGTSAALWEVTNPKWQILPRYLAEPDEERMRMTKLDSSIASYGLPAIDYGHDESERGALCMGCDTEESCETREG